MKNKTSNFYQILIVLTIILTSSISVKSQINFEPKVVITTSENYPIEIFASDFDGDGDIDILSASKDDNKISWYENSDGEGTFELEHIITTVANGRSAVYADIEPRPLFVPMSTKS